MSTVARVICQDYQGVAPGLRRALELLGSTAKFAASGEPVLVKPNLLAPASADRAVTTHPEFLGAVLEILSDIGAKPVVGDSPGFGGAKLVARTSGLLKACRRHNVELIDLADTGQREVKAGTFRSLELAAGALDAGRIWNLPKWKTHTMMGLTLGVKNLYGCVPGARKIAGHLRSGKDSDSFALMLLDLWTTLKPALTLLDGVVAMEGPGPNRGNPIKRGLILASSHAPSLDHEATRLSGFSPSSIPTVRLSIKGGILDPARIKVVGDEAEVMKFAPSPGSPTDMEIIPSFLRNLLRGIMTPVPGFSQETCVDCGICVEACPAKALTRGLPPEIRKEVCIRCYCCQELCPKGAVTVPSTLFFKRRK